MDGRFSNKIFYSNEAHFIINKIVVFGGSENPQVFKERLLYAKKSLFGALFDPKV